MKAINNEKSFGKQIYIDAGFHSTDLQGIEGFQLSFGTLPGVLRIKGAFNRPIDHALDLSGKELRIVNIESLNLWYCWTFGMGQLAPFLHISGRNSSWDIWWVGPDDRCRVGYVRGQRLVLVIWKGVWSRGSGAKLTPISKRVKLFRFVRLMINALSNFYAEHVREVRLKILAPVMRPYTG